MAPHGLALVLFGGAATVASGTRGMRGTGVGANIRGHLSMQPEVVANLLIKVEDEWKLQAFAFAECDNSTGSNCSSPGAAFQHSCSSVTNAVVQGSSGDKSKVVEYMSLICNQPQLDGWKRARCQNLAEAVEGAMTADSYFNREQLDVANPCSRLWSTFIDESIKLRESEKKRAALQALADEQRRQEEAKKAAEAAAAEEKRRQEEAKQAAEKAAADEKIRQEEEAARQREEAAKQAAAAKLAAEEAAEALKAKQIEVAQQAEAAKQHLLEAQEKAARLKEQQVELAAKKANMSVPVKADAIAAPVPANKTVALANATKGPVKAPDVNATAKK